MEKLARSQRQLDLEHESTEVLELAGSLMDRSTWASDPGKGDYWDFLPDEQVRKFVRSRIVKPAHYDDVITELYFWGTLNAQTPVTMGEVEGHPDLCIDGNEPVWADVKRIHRGSAPSRVKKVIAKANHQIKCVDRGGVGLALLYIEREGLRASFDDRTPSDVKPFVDAAAEAIGGDSYRSVAQAVITWDDYFITAEPGEPAIYTARRRSLVLEHAHPRRPAALPSSVWEVGTTATIEVNYTGSGRRADATTLKAEDIVITDQFRIENEFVEGIRTNHIREIIADPDAQESFDLGNVEVRLITRKIEFGRRPYVTLLLIATHTGQKPVLTSAFKLYGSNSQLRSYACTPSEAFKALLDSFGLTIRVGSQQGVFVEHEFIPNHRDGMQLVKVPGSDNGIVLCFYTPLPAGGADVKWAFAIDRGAYRSGLRAS